ncbi:MAG TPA: hypothetical protein VF384_00690 [Planctomycetota bacterium]
MRLARALVFASVAALASAQDPPSRAPDPVFLVANAERLIANKEDVEGAALLLWQALEVLATRPADPMRDATATTARHLLEAHDQLETERRRVHESVAKQQIELAQAYRSRKWFDAAATRVEVAMRFARDAAAKERTLLEAARPKAKAGSAAAAPTRPSSLLRRENTDLVSGNWTEVDDRLECTTKFGGNAEWVTKATHADHEVVVEFRPEDANKGHDACLAIGLHTLEGTENYSGYRAHYDYSPRTKRFGLVLWCIRGMEFTKLGEVSGTAETTPAGFHRLSIQVRGQKLRAQVDAQSPLVVDAAEEVRGAVGLVLGLSDRPTCAVQFRNLRIDSLPANAPTDDPLREQTAAEVQQSITGLVDQAKALIAKKQPEAASLALRDALGELRKLPAGVPRTNLATPIEHLLNQTDSLTSRRKKAGQSIGAELVGLADKYAATGMVRLAHAQVEDAADFDPDGQAARLASAREAVQAWNVAQAAARASELAPPADDGALLRVRFAQGRRLDNRSQGWKVEGPAASVLELGPGEMTSLMPTQGTPPLSKASVHVHLPAASTAAGFCFDVASPNDYSVALLFRARGGLELRAYRYTREWTELRRRVIPMDAWRLDGWFPITIETTSAGITVRAAGDELLLERSHLGTASGRFGLCASNGAKEALTVELRAFQIPP